MGTTDTTGPREGWGLDPDMAAIFERALAQPFSNRGKALRLLSEAIAVADAAGEADTTLRALGSLARAQRCFACRDAAGMKEEAQRALGGLPRDLHGARGHAMQLLGRAALIHGALAEARSWLEQGLEEAIEADAVDLQAQALVRLADVEAGEGRTDAAAALCLRARSLHRRSGDRAAEEGAVFQHGVILLNSGPYIEAVALLQEAVDLCRKARRSSFLSSRLSALAEAQRLGGLREESLANATEALSLAQAAGDREQCALAWSVLTDIRLTAGDFDGALEAGEARMAIAREFGETGHLVDAASRLAIALLRKGRMEDAQAVAAEALRAGESATSPWMRRAALLAAGEVALHTGRPEEGIDHLEAGLCLFAPQDARRRASVQQLLADAHEKRGDLEATVRALRASTASLEEMSTAEARIRLQHLRAGRRVEQAEAAAAEAERRAARALLDAQEDERRYIARELHDDLSQRMALHVIELETLAEQIPPQALDARPQAVALAESMRDTAASLHRISRRLHPALLERVGLRAAMQSFASELEEHYGVKVRLATTGLEDRLPPDVELCVFRVFQEALQNVVRHSGVKTARATLWRDTNEARLLVEDRGCGFDARAVGTDGIGLVGMRERARQCGGRVLLQTAPGKGTRVEVRIPAVPT